VVSERGGSGQLTCASVTGRSPEALAVGDKPDNRRLLRIMATTIGLSAAAAILGLAAGGVISLVTWRRRKAYRTSPAARAPSR
jgi:hypothetical protein